MNCKDVIKIIPDYINNNLESKKSEQVKEHLTNCSECNYIYQNSIKSFDYLKHQKIIPKQAFYYTRLKQKMENLSDKKYNREGFLTKQKILQPLLYLSSIILAVYIGILIGSNSNTENQYSTNEINNENYIEVFSKSQYLNDFEMESLENSYFSQDTLSD